jgi:CheY-like chemotaxis protein
MFGARGYPLDTRVTLRLSLSPPDFREAASALLRAEGFDVVGAVEDGPAALAAVERLRPAVVLLDLQLPGGLDGFGVAERIAEIAEPLARSCVRHRR